MLAWSEKLNFIWPKNLYSQVLRHSKYWITDVLVTHCIEQFITSFSDAVLDEKLDECMKYCPVLLDNVPTVFVSLGKHGVMVGQREHSTLTFKHYPAGPDHLLPVKVTSASGAGDR